MKKRFPFWQITVMCFALVLPMSVWAQKKVVTVTVQTTGPDGSQSTKTITLDGDEAGDVDWNELLGSQVSGDDQAIINIDVDEEDAQDRMGDFDCDRAFLGINYDNYGRSKGGIEVTSVVGGTAAQAAGIKSGDIITAIDGRNIKDDSDLISVLSEHRGGEEVSISLKRGGNELVKKAKLGCKSRESYNYGGCNDNRDMQERAYVFRRDIEMDADEITREAEELAREAEELAREAEEIAREAEAEGRDIEEITREIEEITRSTERQFRNRGVRLGVTVNDDGNGPVIRIVSPNSPAEEGGLKEGDVIVGLNGDSIFNTQQLNATIRVHNTGDSITVNYRRGNEIKQVTVRLRELVPDIRFERPMPDYGAQPNRGRSRRSITIEKSISLGDTPTPPADNELVLEQLDLFPNPTTDELRVVAKVALAESVEMSIVNASGQAVVTHTDMPNAGSIDHVFSLSGQPAGTYTLSIRQGAKVITEQIQVRD